MQLFDATTETTRSFFAQRDLVRVFHYVTDCLNMMNASSLPLCGTYHQTCWLAAACTSLLLFASSVPGTN